MSSIGARGQTADSFDPNANDLVRVVVLQQDGKILIGGNFTTLSPNGGPAITRNSIAKLNPDGTLDILFNPNADGVVYDILLQPDGKILASGTFQNIGGQTRNGIARLDMTTGLADSFDPNAFGIDTCLAFQADGKILAGGTFLNAGGQSRVHMARLDPTTGLADSFDPHVAPGAPNAIAVQADGNILVGGSFTNIGGQPRNYIARLDPTTGLANSFDPNANGSIAIHSMRVQADGNILAGGSFTSIGGQPRNYIARLDAATGLADSFDPSANDTVRSIAQRADGTILAGGDFTNIGGQIRNHIARLDATTGQRRHV